MTKHKLLLGAAMMALMIGGTHPATAQYYTEYKPNDKPLVEIDMGVLGVADDQERYPAPGYVPPVAKEPLSAAEELTIQPEPEAVPAQEPAPAESPGQVLKPAGLQAAEMIGAIEPDPPPAPAPATRSVRNYPDKPYRPYLTTPAEKNTSAPQMVAQQTTRQPLRSYPPEPTKKEVESDPPAYTPALAPQPVRSYPPAATPKSAPETAWEEPVPVPALAPTAEAELAAPSPKELPKPAHKPAVAKQSPSVVDDPGYTPDYSGYYKSGTPVPAAVANLEQKRHVPKPEVPAAVPPAPELEPTPKLDPLPQIATEKSIEQDMPPSAALEPILKPVSTPAPSYQTSRTGSKIISYPDSTVVTRPVTAPAYQPSPAMTPAPKPEPAPAVEAAAADTLPIVIPAKRDPAPPAALAAAMEKTETIIPPPQPENSKTDISKLAARIDGAASEMAAPAAPTEPEKFAIVPTMSDLTLDFDGDSIDLTGPSQRKLDGIVRQMADLVDGGRLQVRSYATGEEGSKSSARRISLARALSVRSYLMEKGVTAKRIDVRAMGAETDRNPLDRVDLIFQK